MAGEALEEGRFVGADTEMEHLHLCLRPSQCDRALERRRVVMLVDKVEHFVAGRGDERPKRDVRSRSRRQPHAAAKAKDRIEHGAGGVGERPTIDDGDRCANQTASTEKARSVGFELQAADGVPFDDGQMRRPDFGFVG